MNTARTLRNDREKMGEQPMYRPSRGHGQAEPQPHQAGGNPRLRRGDDPLAELARLIGQEDPFKEFDASEPRRAPPNGKAHGHAPVVASERRPERYANGNGVHANGAGQVARSNGRDASLEQTRQPAPRQAAAVAPRATALRVEERADRHPVRVPTQVQPRVNGTARAYEDQQPRPNGRDAYGQYADRAVRSRDAYASGDDRTARAAVAEQPFRRPAQQAEARYVPDETPRHARSRPQQAPVQDRYQRSYEDDYDPQYDDEAYLPDHADDIYDDVQRPGRGWGFWLVVGVVVASLIAVAFLGVFAYRTIFNTPPRAAIVTKSNAPVKVEPKNTPQTAVPQSNKPIQDRVGGAQDQTQIMRREEAPADLTQQRVPQQQQQPQFQQPVAQPQQQVPVQRAPQFTPPSQQPQAPQNTDSQTKRVKSIPLRSDGTTQQPNAGPQSNTPMHLGPNAQAQEPDTQAIPQNRTNAPAPRNTVASLGPTPAPQTSGNYVVQVASHKTPEEAQGAWSNLRQQYASIFSGRNADIRKVDLGDRGTFYRAMVGPMNREQANALCQNLKTQGAGCIVQTR